MPRQFVSICGHSAAGKKTLIQKLLANEPAGLRERFRITDPVQAYGLFHDPDKQQLKIPGREQEPYHMLKAKEQTILHFWQDNTHPWIAYLREMFPHDTHRVILLWRPWESHSQALLARPTPEYRPTAQDVRDNWNQERVPQFRALQAKGFTIELTHGETYEPLSEWPS